MLSAYCTFLSWCQIPIHLEASGIWPFFSYTTSLWSHPGWIYGFLPLAWVCQICYQTSSQCMLNHTRIVALLTLIPHCFWLTSGLLLLSSVRDRHWFTCFGLINRFIGLLIVHLFEGAYGYSLARLVLFVSYFCTMGYAENEIVQ